MTLHLSASCSVQKTPATPGGHRTDGRHDRRHRRRHSLWSRTTWCRPSRSPPRRCASPEARTIEPSAAPRGSRGSSTQQGPRASGAGNPRARTSEGMPHLLVMASYLAKPDESVSMKPVDCPKKKALPLLNQAPKNGS